MSRTATPVRPYAFGRTLNPSSRNILTRYTARMIEGDTLFARLGRAVCEAECLPRKEFFEAWEVAKRVHRKLRGGTVLELAAGHGLLAAMLLILDDHLTEAICVDVTEPPSHRRVLRVLEARWPRLAGRIHYREQRIDETQAAPESLVISVHACGALTDQTLDLAVSARSRVVVLPCCHDLKRCDTGELTGWMDGPLAVDATRVARLHGAGYRVLTATIPADITPKNRLLMAWPDPGVAGA